MQRPDPLRSSGDRIAAPPRPPSRATAVASPRDARRAGAPRSKAKGPLPPVKLAEGAHPAARATMVQMRGGIPSNRRRSSTPALGESESASLAQLAPPTASLDGLPPADAGGGGDDAGTTASSPPHRQTRRRTSLGDLDLRGGGGDSLGAGARSRRRSFERADDGGGGGGAPDLASLVVRPRGKQRAPRCSSTLGDHAGLEAAVVRRETEGQRPFPRRRAAPARMLRNRGDAAAATTRIVREGVRRDEAPRVYGVGRVAVRRGDERITPCAPPRPGRLRRRANRSTAR